MKRGWQIDDCVLRKGPLKLDGAERTDGYEVELDLSRQREAAASGVPMFQCETVEFFTPRFKKKAQAIRVAKEFLRRFNLEWPEGSEEISPLSTVRKASVKQKQDPVKVLNEALATSAFRARLNRGNK